jgi:hypothetical protein
MQKKLRGSGDFGLRHELDALVPASVISAEPATQKQLPALAEIAKREIPGVNAKVGLARFLRADPESIFTFRRGDRLLGGIAFLYFNCRGHDALLLDNIDLKNPNREFLAASDEEVSAIYVWALAAYGRAVMGIANVAAYLRRPRFVGANYFAQPSSSAGRDLLIALGFEPIPSFQADLWCYERPWNRPSLMLPVAGFSLSPGSYADARH